jgi:glycosyltransferase involved in cell wall biosynthesis
LPEPSPSSPAFTVVIATYGRGVLIEPTLDSVAAQTLADCEILVVSDGAPAPHLMETVARFGDRFSLLQLPARARSQAGPNNLGWDRARGRYIAYLGHDDIWHPEHLERLLETFERHPDSSFAVSGCLYFGPPGAVESHTWVTGIFDSADVNIAQDHFFPPSSFAHLRDLPVRVPRWQSATKSVDPVDSRFLKSAAAAGLRFASTGVVTVFKFASALRYLSYLSPDDAEQRSVLARMDDRPRFDSEVARAVRRAQRDGRFMPLRYEFAERLPAGEHLRRVERARGIEATKPPALDSTAWLPAGDDPRGFDWHPAEPSEEPGVTWRWSGPSERPRLRVPFVGAKQVRFAVFISDFESEELRAVTVLVNRQRVDSTLTRFADAECEVLRFTAPLLADRASVVEFLLPSAGAPVPEDAARRGFCLVGIALEPSSTTPVAGLPGEARQVLDAIASQILRDTMFGTDFLRVRADAAEADRAQALASRRGRRGHRDGEVVLTRLKCLRRSS